MERVAGSRSVEDDDAKFQGAGRSLPGLRRKRADGSFGGTLSTSMGPAHFAGFYSGLTDPDPNLHVALAGSVRQ